MIEVVGLGRRETLAGAEACLAVVMRADADQLALAAHWADLHDPASLPAQAAAARAAGATELRVYHAGLADPGDLAAIRTLCQPAGAAPAGHPPAGDPPAAAPLTGDPPAGDPSGRAGPSGQVSPRSAAGGPGGIVSQQRDVQ